MLVPMQSDWPWRFSTGDESILCELLPSLGRQIGTELAGHYRHVFARDQVEQIVLEAFARGWQSRSKFSPAKGPLDEWLRAIARNLAADRAGSGWAKARSLEVRLEPMKLDEYPDPVPDSPGNEDQSPVVQALHDILRRLPKMQRAVLERDPSGDIPSRELASEFGIAAATVRVHRKRGMDRIRARLRELGFAVPDQDVLGGGQVRKFVHENSSQKGFARPRRVNGHLYSIIGKNC